MGDHEDQQEDGIGNTARVSRDTPLSTKGLTLPDSLSKLPLLDSR
jgi:hypothetical protein